MSSFSALERCAGSQLGASGGDAVYKLGQHPVGACYFLVACSNYH